MSPARWPLKKSPPESSLWRLSETPRRELRRRRPGWSRTTSTLSPTRRSLGRGTKCESYLSTGSPTSGRANCTSITSTDTRTGCTCPSTPRSAAGDVKYCKTISIYIVGPWFLHALLWDPNISTSKIVPKQMNRIQIWVLCWAQQTISTIYSLLKL